MNLGDRDKKYLESIRASARMLEFFAYGFWAFGFISCGLALIFGWRGLWLGLSPFGFAVCMILDIIAVTSADRLEAQLHHEGKL